MVAQGSSIGEKSFIPDSGLEGSEKGGSEEEISVGADAAH